MPFPWVQPPPDPDALFEAAEQAAAARKLLVAERLSYACWSASQRDPVVRFDLGDDVQAPSDTAPLRRRRTLPLAYLAPAIVEAVLKGRQLFGLAPRQLKRLGALPCRWLDQPGPGLVLDPAILIGELSCLRCDSGCHVPQGLDRPMRFARS